MMLSLDHITVTALDLADGVAHVEAALGIIVPPGGRHPLMATHNHLLRLGDGLFLEVIAPDATCQAPGRKRWFDLDRMGREGAATPPRLATWVARTPSIVQAIATITGAAGPAVQVTRGDLSWSISVPDDGSMPYEGAFPTLIEWPPGIHPADRMPDQGCALVGLAIEHPRGEEIAGALRPHLHDDRIRIRTGTSVRLAADIMTPAGLRRLT